MCHTPDSFLLQPTPLQQGWGGDDVVAKRPTYVCCSRCWGQAQVGCHSHLIYAKCRCRSFRDSKHIFAKRYFMRNIKKKLKLNLQLSFSQFHVIPFEVFYARKISDGQPGIEFVGVKVASFTWLGAKYQRKEKQDPNPSWRMPGKFFRCTSISWIQVVSEWFIYIFYS